MVLSQDNLTRHAVFRSGRIETTEGMITPLVNARVLEIGAGDYSFDYLQGRAEGSWTKIDFAPPCDVVCELNDQQLVLPFDDTCFDLIICTEVIEHLLWPQRLLSEAHRVLTDNGRILISVPNCASLSYRIAWLLGRIPSCAASGNLPPELGSTAYCHGDGATVGGHVVDFNQQRIELLFSHTGFSVVSIRGSGIIWHRQILPAWSVPPSLSSNIICLARKSHA